MFIKYPVVWDSVFGDWKKKEEKKEEEEEVVEKKGDLSLTEYWASLQVFYTHSIYIFNPNHKSTKQALLASPFTYEEIKALRR